MTWTSLNRLSLYLCHHPAPITHTSTDSSTTVGIPLGRLSTIFCRQSCDVGLTYDILDKSFYKPIVVALTNPSCSTTTSTLPLSNGFTCDATLMVENETLKKEVNELTLTLGKAYGGENRLLMCLGSQRASLYKEGLGYTPKKGKAAFAPHKTSFVKNNGWFCNSCK